MFIHVSLIVAIPGSGELKSKPTQHSAKELLSLGIQPDVIMCRSDAPVPPGHSGENFPVLQHPGGERHPQSHRPHPV